jgi:hypothetical protein
MKHLASIVHSIVLAGLIVVVAWLALLQYQPKQFEGWTLDKRVSVKYLQIESRDSPLGWIINSENNDYFCRKGILWQIDAFAGINIPAKKLSGGYYACLYHTEYYELPWDKFSNI